MKIRLILSLILFATTAIGFASADAGIDYVQLSKEPSEKLMEEGRTYFERRQAPEALSRFMVVSERYKADDTKENIEFSVRALNNVGCIYKFLYYDYPAAYESFSRAYQMCIDNGINDFLPVIMVNMGDLLNDYGIIYNSETIKKQAEALFDKCFSMALEKKNWELLTTAFFNISNLNYELDLPKYKAIFRNDIPETSPDIKYARLQYKGIEMLQQKKYAESRDFFRQQFEAVNTPWESDRDRISTYLNIANTYHFEGDSANETEFLKKALEISERAEIRDLTANIYRQLAECFDKVGDQENYQKYRLQYLEKMEEMHNSRVANIAEMKYLADLKAEEERAQELLMRERIQVYVIWSVVAILLLIIIFLCIIWRKNRILNAGHRALFDKYQKLLENDKTSAANAKYSGSNLNDDHREELITRIRESMENPDNICRSDFSSKELAKIVDSNTTYVSQVINETFGISFSTLLGNCRVKEACRRINEDESYKNLTIEGIANSVGFKSRTALLNAFKREVGISPSEYIRMAKKSEKHTSGTHS